MACTCHGRTSLGNKMTITRNKCNGWNICSPNTSEYKMYNLNNFPKDRSRLCMNTKYTNSICVRTVRKSCLQYQGSNCEKRNFLRQRISSIPLTQLVKRSHILHLKEVETFRLLYVSKINDF